MNRDDITPDVEVLWSVGPFDVNLTLVSTWVVMVVVIGAAWSVTRRLSSSSPMSPSRWQHVLEVLVEFLGEQIRAVSGRRPDRYLAFVGTIFVFLFVSNTLVVLPWYVPPTASLSTAVALAVIVFSAVPVFGVVERGVGRYLAGYLEPNPVMLPFNVVAELSRTLALAVRLFGNVMSFTKIVGIVFLVAPLVFPAVLNALGLLTGVIQAYIFTVLTIVYVSAGSGGGSDDEEPPMDEIGTNEEGATWTNGP